MEVLALKNAINTKFLVEAQYILYGTMSVS